MSELKPLRDLKSLRDYNNWIGHTAYDVQHAVIGLGGWGNVFPGSLPRWASRIRQYFNLNPMTLRLLDENESGSLLARAQTAIPASNRAKARRNELQSRGMGISFYAPGSSTKPGTPLRKPDPRDPINNMADEVATFAALTGDVYEDELGRTIWFQMVPGAAIYHLGVEVTSPTVEAISANFWGQINSPLFKLVSPDGTGGSRECCITNPADFPYKVGNITEIKGRHTLGAVNETVDVTGRFVTDSVNQGSYNYAETVQQGLPAHERLDVKTDPMEQGYFVEPPNLFQFSDVGLLSDLHLRRFPEKHREKILADQKEHAP